MKRLEHIKYLCLKLTLKGEKNDSMCRELENLVSFPYHCATKELNNITKQLVTSQKMVQGVSASLRKLSKDLFILEEVIDEMNANTNLSIFNEPSFYPIKKLYFA